MATLSQQLEEVEDLVREKHQAGRHSQQSHDPTKGRGGGAGATKKKPKTPKTHGTAAGAFERAMPGKVGKIRAEPGHGKFTSIRRVAGDKTAKAGTVLGEMGFEKFDDMWAGKNVTSYQAGDLKAAVRYNGRETRVTFVDRAKGQAASEAGRMAAIRRTSYYD
jgi:hypothetical protein